MSGRINWTPEQFWEYVEGLAGDFKAGQMRDMLAECGLRLAAPSVQEPDREILWNLVKQHVIWMLYDDDRLADYPIFVAYDDRGLEEYEYLDFAQSVFSETLSVIASRGSSSTANTSEAWQDISTAPKDGTFIHVWFPDNGDSIASKCLTCSWKLLPESGLATGAWFAQSGGRAFRMDGASHWKPMDGPNSRNDSGVASK